MIISVVALAVVIYLLDLQKFKQAILQADIRYIFSGALACLLWLTVRAFFWRTLLQNKASYRATFLTINEGYLLNNVLPFRLGEVARALLMGRKARLDFWQVIPSILIERALDMAIAVGLFLSILPFVIGVSWAKQAAIAIGVVVVIGFGMIYLLALNRQRVLAWVEQAALKWPLVGRFAGRRVVAFFDGLAILTDRRLFLTALGWEGLNWMVASLQNFLFLKAFFPQVNVLWVLFVLGAGGLGIAAPSSPGALGVYEAALVGALVAFGLDASPAAAYAITMHVVIYLLTGSIGGYALYKDGESLSSLYTRLRRLKSGGETIDTVVITHVLVAGTLRAAIRGVKIQL